MATRNIRRASDVNPQVLYAAPLSGTTTFEYYVCPADTSAKVVTATLCNTVNAVRTVYLSVVKAGGTTGDGNRVAIINLEPLESTIVTELIGTLLGPGDKIAGYASTTATVAFVMTGVVSS